MKSFIFFLLVFVLSIPFWILTAFTPDITTISFIKLPMSALMTFCPMLAAIILVKKSGEDGTVKELLAKTFDYKKIENRKWYIVIVFFMPLLVLLTYWYMKLARYRFLNQTRL